MWVGPEHAFENPVTRKYRDPSGSSRPGGWESPRSLRHSVGLKRHTPVTAWYPPSDTQLRYGHAFQTPLKLQLSDRADSLEEGSRARQARPSWTPTIFPGILLPCSVALTAGWNHDPGGTKRTIELRPKDV